MPGADRDEETRRSVGERWLRPSHDVLRSLLALPELALVDESCAAERALHDRLVADPSCDVRATELAALADADARENYATFLQFRSAIVAAGSIEAHYLALVRSARVAVPPVFLDTMVAAIVDRLLGGSADVVEQRAGQLLHRVQRVAFADGRVLAADRDRADRAGARELDLVRDFAIGADRLAGLPVLGAANGGDFAAAADPAAFVLDLTHEVANDLGHGLVFRVSRAGSGLAALARVLERWVDHFLGVRTTIRPVPRIDDPAWRWHVGLDAEASAILNALYRGERPDDEQMARIIGLFRLDFADPLEMRADVAGKPVYLGLAMSAEQTLKLKPQNLLINLPLAAPA